MPLILLSILTYLPCKDFSFFRTGFRATILMTPPLLFCLRSCDTNLVAISADRPNDICIEIPGMAIW